MKKYLRRSLVLSSLLATAFLAGSLAQAKDLSSQQMVDLVRNSGVLKPNVSLRATFDDRDKRAVVLTDRLAKSTDNDCKIDSVLVAKKLIDAFPEDINSVRVIFESQVSHRSQQVDVTKVDVKAYGSGAVKASELLASLNLIDSRPASDSTPGGLGGEGAADLSVAPGPFADQRLILLGRIGELRQHGTDVKPFQDLFDKIEAKAAGGNAMGLRADIAYLSDKLKEEEDLVKQAGMPKLPATGIYSGQNRGLMRRRNWPWGKKKPFWLQGGPGAATSQPQGSPAAP